jgi:hypothetical protein
MSYAWRERSLNTQGLIVVASFRLLGRRVIAPRLQALLLSDTSAYC